MWLCQRGWKDLAQCIGNRPLENLSEISGYAASTLVLFTFVAKDMRLLRTIAIFSNLAFITYGTIEWLPPVLFLHLVLLPLNIVRLAEFVRATRSTSDLPQPDGVVGVQTLGADMTCRDQSPSWGGFFQPHCFSIITPPPKWGRDQRVRPNYLAGAFGRAMSEMR